MSNAWIQALVTAALDAALDVRVALHQEREHNRLSVIDYKQGLRSVREVESQLEQLRDAEHTRAYELAIEDRP